MLITASLTPLIAGLVVEAQHLRVTLDPPAHEAAVTSTITVRGEGPARVELTALAELEQVTVDGAASPHRRVGGDDRAVTLQIDLPRGARTLSLSYRARFVQDVQSGERAGQIHNFAVDAHLGEDGIFLSDGSAWHPRPVNDDDRPLLHPIRVEVEPIEGWVIVASGQPLDEGPIDHPRWHWATPRPVEGMAIVGNRHAVLGRAHPTAHGPVEVVMHVPEEHRDLALMFIDAACDYLDIYTPSLGAFPYRRFSIVENFFSSGFAFPGFTVLGPQVVAMAPRSLAPGYLDHELVHNWWGNGVYVDQDDGNWCEALTTYCANYHRRRADGGEEAARAYRRGVLMKLSSDPESLDNGPLGRFGSADPESGGPDRFVGYDKGAFVFCMLEDVLAGTSTDLDPGSVEPMWGSLRRLADEHLGRRAGWADLQACFEAQAPDRPAGWLDGFFDRWVRQHTVPRTFTQSPEDAAAAFAAQFEGTGQPVPVAWGPQRAWCEIDPDFRLYRVLPPAQIVPTIAGTLGAGGVQLDAPDDAPGLGALMEQMDVDPDGENLLLIGPDAVERHAGLLAESSDPGTFGTGYFEVGGVRYDEPEQAVLHSMQHPQRPGRFITIFHSNGEAGWARLRMIRFYSRDTTIVWSGRRVIERRVHEPDRRIGS